MCSRKVSVTGKLLCASF
uniref:Uncharacterized protein n=1 Tax=Arundo donax TaxID=35708 RepID=A0A0A8XXR3_ARUDO